MREDTEDEQGPADLLDVPHRGPHVLGEWKPASSGTSRSREVCKNCRLSVLNV